MPTIRLTPQNVPRLEAVAGRHTDYRDELQPGLVLRVTPAGFRSYAVRYYRNRRHRRYTIGEASRVTLAQARAEAKRVLARATMGADPQREKVEARQAHTVKGLADAFMAWKDGRVQPSTHKLWSGILAHRVYPKIGSVSAVQLTRADVRGLVERIAAEAPVMANRTLQLLRAVYAWGVGRDLVPGSPCVGIEKPAAEESSDRVLSPAELVALQAALCTTADDGADVVWLLLYTGVRLRMVTGMRRDELAYLDEPARALWTIPGGYAGRMKNRRPHEVPLTRQALAVIERRLKAHRGAFLFPNHADHRRPIVWRSGFVERLRAAMERLHEGGPVAPWTIHNLRHTMRTHLREEHRVPDDVAELILGHVEGGVKGIYKRARLLGERRAALATWCEWLVALRTERRGRVLAMAGGRRGLPVGDTRGRSSGVSGGTTSHENST